MHGKRLIPFFLFLIIAFMPGCGRINLESELPPQNNIFPWPPPVPPPPVIPPIAAHNLIAFASYNGSFYELWTIKPDGSGLKCLFSESANSIQPTWSPDGTRIAFRSDRDGFLQVYVIWADGTGITRLTSDSFPEMSPQWSPKGDKLVFVGLPPGEAAEIFTISASGGASSRLTNDPAVDGAPSWSPDGTKIAFSSNRSGPYQIYVMDADGSNPQPVPGSQGLMGRPAWSPDGNYFAFSRNTSPVSIGLIPVAGGTITTLTAQGDTEPDWSPDGKEIVFTSSRNVLSEIYLIGADGNGLKRLTNNATTDGNPAWSPP